MHEIENILSANLTVFIKLFEERHILWVSLQYRLLVAENGFL
jgi:hypothetical protein